jgi:hypothetical protein
MKKFKFKFKFNKNKLNKVSPKKYTQSSPHAKTKLIQKIPTCFPQNLKMIDISLLTPHSIISKNKEKSINFNK